MLLFFFLLLFFFSHPVLKSLTPSSLFQTGEDIQNSFPQFCLAISQRFPEQVASQRLLTFSIEHDAKHTESNPPSFCQAYSSLLHFFYDQIPETFSYHLDPDQNLTTDFIASLLSPAHILSDTLSQLSLCSPSYEEDIHRIKSQIDETITLLSPYIPDKEECSFIAMIHTLTMNFLPEEFHQTPFNPLHPQLILSLHKHSSYDTNLYNLMTSQSLKCRELYQSILRHSSDLLFNFPNPLPLFQIFSIPPNLIAPFVYSNIQIFFDHTLTKKISKKTIYPQKAEVQKSLLTTFYHQKHKIFFTAIS